MAHWSGLLTATEVTERIGVYTDLAIGTQIDFYKNMIMSVQQFTPAQRTLVIGRVVPTGVTRFFRVTMASSGYTTVESTTGQPAGMTLWTSVSW